MARTQTAKSGTKVTQKSTPHGGVRRGAGRPVGSGKYGCKTKAMRVPEHLVGEIQAFALKKVKMDRKRV